MRGWRRAALAAALLLSVGGAATDEAAPPGALEGRPPGAAASPLQAAVDRTPSGGTLEVPQGTYRGDLFLDRPLRLRGRGRPLLIGSGTGSVLRIRAPGVVVEGLDLDGRGGGDLGRDSSGIHVAAPGAVIRDCRIERTLFGVYLREAHGTVVEQTSIRGVPGKAPGEKGSGIHVWNTRGFRLGRNTITDVRDGFYIQSSSGGTIVGNVARDVRYGIHYMYSDDNVFLENTFENGAAGAALMYSRRITFQRNRFLRNRGYASVGLLLKACDDVLAEDNLIADNARGVFLEGSYRNTLRRNVVAGSDVAIVLYDSCSGNRFSGNAFLGNMTPLLLVGRRTDTVFEGNYWSDSEQPDLDGDGRGDRPHRLGSVFDHFRGNLTAADLLTDSLAASALAAAERSLPILHTVRAEDPAPLVRPPRLPGVPLPTASPGGAQGGGLALSLGCLAAGGAALLAGRRRTWR